MTIESDRISAFIEGKIRREGVLLKIDASYEIDKPFDDNAQVELILNLHSAPYECQYRNFEMPLR